MRYSMAPFRVGRCRVCKCSGPIMRGFTMRPSFSLMIFVFFAITSLCPANAACLFCSGGALSIDKPFDKGGGLSIDKPLDKGGSLSIDKPFDKGGSLSIDKPFDKGGSLSIDKVECGGDVCKTLEKAAKDTVAETNRGLKNLGDAGKAIEHFVENEIHGIGQSLSDAEKRIREGKVVDAFWHFATDPAKHVERDAAEAAAE